MTGNIWFGDYASYMGYLDKLKKIDDPAYMATMRSMWESDRKEQDEDEEYESWLLERRGNTAVLNVAGDLVNTKAWYNEYLGMVSYEEIQEALAEAGADESVDQVLMHFSTGGGTASGIKAAGDYIGFFDQNVKPVYGYTATAAFSAGYWLASSTRKITVDEMGQLGSIGAVNVHVSYKGMLDKNGVVYTILREGEFKALGHPAEDLDEKSKAYFQDKLAKANSFFIEAVVRNRNVSLASQADWGEGKTFYGREALNLGLADEVATLQDLLGRFQVSRSGDGRTIYGGTMPKEKLKAEEAQQAPAPSDNGAVAGQGLAEGHREAVAGQGLDDLNPEGRADLSAEELAKLEAGLPIDEGLVSKVAANTTSNTPEEASAGEEGEELSTQAPEMGEELKTVMAERDALAEKLQAAEDLNAQMKGIVLEAANKKVIAMGGIPMDLDFLDCATAVQHYEKVDTKFKSTFKVGQRSVSTDTSKPEVETGEGLSAAPTFAERAVAHKRKQPK
jgi:signal peptide peptidase SppA